LIGSLMGSTLQNKYLFPDQVKKELVARFQKHFKAEMEVGDIWE